MTPDSPLITSTHNRRITEAVKLVQRKHRQDQRRFLVEGLQLLHMALDAGICPVEVFTCEPMLKGTEGPALIQRFAAARADLVPVSESVMERLSDRSGPQGIVATFALFDTSFRQMPLAGDELVLVLDRLQDPGNLGTLIRTADAAGAALIALIEPCVDVFDPKVVRASMGSLFNVPLIVTPDVPRLFDWLAGTGLRRVGADPVQGVWDIAAGGAALVLGNEARGLSDDVRPYLDDWVRLPIIGKAELLNVSVAGGVLMYMWLRANMP